MFRLASIILLRKAGLDFIYSFKEVVIQGLLGASQCCMC